MLQMSLNRALQTARKSAHETDGDGQPGSAQDHGPLSVQFELSIVEA